MSLYDAVLFDLDGTLVDTAPDFASVLNRMLAAAGREPLPYATIRAAVSQGASTVVGLGFGDLGMESDAFARQRQAFLDDYSRHLADDSCLFPGLDAILDTLEEQRIPWGVVTNKPSRYTLPLLEQLGLGKRCAVTICPDMVTRTKPDPEPMLKACDQIKVDPRRSVYVGDHLRDIQAGKAAGMPTIAAGWGYIPATEDIRSWQADHLAASVTDLATLLAR